MPIVIEYPQASLRAGVELTHAVDDLGGRCSTEMAAERMGMKVGGGYKTLVGAAAKYGLITSKSGFLETTALFKDFKLAYSTEEGEKVLQRCFLTPAVFKNIYDRFKGRELPTSYFQKLLIKEFGVNEAVSSRVAKYFVDGAKMCGLMGADNKLLEAAPAVGIEEMDEPDRSDTSIDVVAHERKPEPERQPSESSKSTQQGYTVRISGPGMDSVVAINEADDLDIVEIMLRKVRRQLGDQQNDGAGGKA